MLMNPDQTYSNTPLFQYDHAALQQLLGQVLQQHLTADAWQWLQEQGQAANDPNVFNRAFSMVPRKVGQAAIRLTNEQHQQFQALRRNLFLDNRTADQLCRIWLLLQLDATDQHGYFKKLEALFLTAAVSEATALYIALPLLARPEQWQARCAEGIRSNIGDVLQAIMCLNPYPSEQLGESEWNQLVLKAIFTDKPVHQIIGLEERANQKLADTLADYARERWAAGRTVNPMLWRCVGRFMTPEIFPCIERLALSLSEKEQQAAVLACRESAYAPAKALLNNRPQLKQLNASTTLTWETLAQEL
jgi:hypothetical protein